MMSSITQEAIPGLFDKIFFFWFLDCTPHYFNEKIWRWFHLNGSLRERRELKERCQSSYGIKLKSLEKVLLWISAGKNEMTCGKKVYRWCVDRIGMPLYYSFELAKNAVKIYPTKKLPRPYTVQIAPLLLI